MEIQKKGPWKGLCAQRCGAEAAGKADRAQNGEAPGLGHAPPFYGTDSHQQTELCSLLWDALGPHAGHPAEARWAQTSCPATGPSAHFDPFEQPLIGQGQETVFSLFPQLGEVP